MSERLFIAIGFDSELSEKLNREVKKVKINLDKADIGYKWVPSENYHVTLVFLGAVEDNRKQEIIQKLSQSASESAGFQLLISGVDAFSSERDARAIYCGVQNKKDLRALVDKVRENLGLTADESYSPHLTIARLRNPANVKDIISPVRRKDFFKVGVSEVRLYKSVLAGPYPVYQVVARFPLLPAALSSENSQSS